MTADLRHFLSPTGVAEEDYELAESFHEETKWKPSLITTSDRRIALHLYDERAVLEASRNQKRYANLALKSLPPTLPESALLRHAQTARSSCRSFDGSLLADEGVSAVLGGLRATRRAQSAIHPDALLHFRAYPSGGGLYPVESYVARPMGDRARWSLAHYAPIEHALTALGEVETEQLEAAMQDRQGLVAGAGMIVVLSGIFRRSMTKYGAMGYRFALIEAGAMVQQVLLAALDQRLSSLVWGSAYDDRVNALFGLDGVDETMIITILIGGPANG